MNVALDYTMRELDNCSLCSLKSKSNSIEISTFSRKRKGEINS